MLCATSALFWKRIGPHVDPDRIADDAAKNVISACRQIDAEGKVPSKPVIVTQRLRRRHEDGKLGLEDFNDARDLLQAAIEEAESYDVEVVIAEMTPVIRSEVEKQALDQGFEIWSKGGDTSRVAQILENAKRIGAREHALGVLLNSSHVMEVYERNQVRRLPTGIAELDRELLGGIRRGTFTVLTGATGVGKSMMLDHILAGCIAPYNSGVGMPSALATVGELTDDDHYARLYGNLTELPYTDILENKKVAFRAESRMRTLEDEQFLTFFTCRFFDAEATTVDDILEWIEAEERHHGIKIPVIGIDYAMNLIEPKKKARHEEIKTISAKLRSHAKSSDKWIITPHQGTGDTLSEKKTTRIDNSQVAEGKGIA